MEKIDKLAQKNREKIIEIHKLAYRGPECFGLAIRKLREYRGWKVYELARKVRIDPVYLTQIEKHNRFPSPAVMEKIAEELKDPFLFKIFLKNKYPQVYEAIKMIDFYSDKEVEDLMEEDIDNLSPEEVGERIKRWDKIEAVAKKTKLKLQKLLKNTRKIDKFGLEAR
jgi:transcriptional regulator with XRE-family HTH domain